MSYGLIFPPLLGSFKRKESNVFSPTDGRLLAMLTGKILFLPALSVLLSVAANGQTFEDFINRVNAAPDSQRTAIVDSFMSAVGNLPLRENDTMCHFIYRGPASSGTVPGDANGWNTNAYPMLRLATTDFMYHTHVFESDARLDYKFFLNGSVWLLDPRNPYTVNGGFGPNSELRMPAYVPAPEIQYYPNIPHGLLWDTTYYSVHLGNSRTIRIYTPPGYANSTDSFGTILFHDGLEYVTLAQANNVIDYLIWQNRIQPVIAIFVPPVNRVAEYRTTQINQFCSFITTEIIPYVDSRFRTRRSPEHRAVQGASDGGNITLWLGLYYSNIFGNVAAQSSNIVSTISTGFQTGPILDLKLYLDLGTYDIAQLIPLVRNFIPILQSRGYVYQYREYHEGHSWGNWRAHVDNALEMFFPSTPAGIEVDRKSTSSYVLEQCFPNPFNPSTTIRFAIPTDQHVRLTVFDILGREVASVLDGRLSAGQHSVTFDVHTMASGVYFYQLKAGQFVGVKKLVVAR